MAWSIKSIFCCVSVLSSSSIDNQPHFRPVSNTSGQSVLIKKETQELLDRMPMILGKQGFRPYPLDVKKVIPHLQKIDKPTYLDLKRIMEEVVQEYLKFYPRITPTEADAKRCICDLQKSIPGLLNAIASYLKIDITSTEISIIDGKTICTSLV